MSRVLRARRARTVGPVHPLAVREPQQFGIINIIIVVTVYCSQTAAEGSAGARTILGDSPAEPSWVTLPLPRSSGHGARGRRRSGRCSRSFCLSTPPPI